MSQERNQLTSVVSYPERGAGGNNRYRGNCSPKLLLDLIDHFQINDICDYMCGSNTTGAAAQQRSIHSHTYDLHSGFDLVNHEIPERPNFIFWHPPYWDIIKYSGSMYDSQAVQKAYGYDPSVSDLSRIPDWNQFVQVMNYCMMKQFSALERGGRMAVLVGDIKKKGSLYSMLFELIKPGMLENVIIKTQHNCNSSSTSYSGKFIPIVHEYLLLIKKEQPLAVPILITNRVQGDLRDMPGCTWKDIVSAVLEDCGGQANLSCIYDKISNHKRARENQWWKEKVRQTLQIYPKLFSSTQRGVWSLQKAG